MGEVEAAVDPDAALVDLDVLLGVHGPLAVGGDPLALCIAVSMAGGQRGRAGADLCALSAYHGGGGLRGPVVRGGRDSVWRRWGGTGQLLARLHVRGDECLGRVAPGVDVLVRLRAWALGSERPCESAGAVPALDRHRGGPWAAPQRIACRRLAAWPWYLVGSRARGDGCATVATVRVQATREPVSARHPVCKSDGSLGPATSSVLCIPSHRRLASSPAARSALPIPRARPAVSAPPPRPRPGPWCCRRHPSSSTGP